MLPDEIVGPVAAAARYARLPIRPRRSAFTSAFHDWLAAQPRERPIFVTAPGLFGPMPGTTNAFGRMLRGYPAAPVLMREMLVAEPEAEIWLTTRKSSDWAKSVHASLSSIRDPGMDAATFAKRLPRLRDVAEGLDAMHPVRVFPMDDAEGHPLGLTGPILDALGLPPETMARLPGGQARVPAAAALPSSAELDLIRTRREQAAIRRARSERRAP